MPEPIRWEDEEKADYTLEGLRKSFNRHMYGTDEVPSDAIPSPALLASLKKELPPDTQ